MRIWTYLSRSASTGIARISAVRVVNGVMSVLFVRGMTTEHFGPPTSHGISNPQTVSPMANSQSILANSQLVLSSSSCGYNSDATLRSDCSRTLRIPDIVSQTLLCETAHARPSINGGTMWTPDMASQTLLCGQTNAQVEPCSKQPPNCSHGRGNVQTWTFSSLLAINRSPHLL